MLASSESGAAPLRYLAQLFGGPTAGFNSLGTFWVFCLMIVICADIIGPTAFNSRILGVA